MLRAHRMTDQTYAAMSIKLGTQPLRPKKLNIFVLKHVDFNIQFVDAAENLLEAECLA